MTLLSQLHHLLSVKFSPNIMSWNDVGSEIVIYNEYTFIDNIIPLLCQSSTINSFENFCDYLTSIGFSHNMEDLNNKVCHSFGHSWFKKRYPKLIQRFSTNNSFVYVSASTSEYDPPIFLLPPSTPTFKTFVPNHELETQFYIPISQEESFLHLKSYF